MWEEKVRRLSHTHGTDPLGWVLLVTRSLTSTTPETPHPPDIHVFRLRVPQIHRPAPSAVTPPQNPSSFRHPSGVPFLLDMEVPPFPLRSWSTTEPPLSVGPR